MNPASLTDTTENLSPLSADPSNDAFNPVLLRLKQEAEDEVNRLRAELSPVREKLIEVEVREARLEVIQSYGLAFEGERVQLKKELPSDVDRAKLKAAKARLEAELAKAEQRLETELAAIRQAETASALTGGRVSRANRELTELLEAAARILPAYAEKLDRIVQSALTIWDRRDRKHDDLKTVGAIAVKALDPLLNNALALLGSEFRGLSEPLKRWIHKLSAVYEEGRLTEIQRMELGLRLTELETKYETAQTILGQLGVL